MTIVLPGLIAGAAALLTFFSGFGLGTLLLPAFLLFFPGASAVGMTAVVHLANGLFKLLLMGRHASMRVLYRFGLPAILGSYAGAWLLLQLGEQPAVASFAIAGRHVHIMPIKLVLGGLLLVFAGLELMPRGRKLEFHARYLPLGGLLSGFFGGLAGMQGALRAAFLARAGLSKEAFIGTSAIIAALIDLVRLSVYAELLRDQQLEWTVVSVAVGCALTGTCLGSWFLHKTTMRGIQRLVSIMLAIVALGLITGLL